MIEIIRRLYYLKKKDAKTIRNIVRALTRTFRDIRVTSLDGGDVHVMIEKLRKLPSTIDCHIGELSLHPELDEPQVILVSSDTNVLKAYEFVDRLDPREFLPKVIPAGQMF